MAVWHCVGYLLGGLGISPGHTAYADSKEELFLWAKQKAIGEFIEYSYTRPDKASINAYASGAIHVAMPYNKATQVDYVMFKNNDIEDDRWYYGSVRHREYVNTNSTRLWFDLDYWLTFIDELRDGLGACMIERSHVKLADDWNGNYPTFEYTNPETFVPKLVEREYTAWNNETANIWKILEPDKYMIYAATDDQGNGNYQVSFVCGSPTACFTYKCISEDDFELMIASYNHSFPLLDKSSADSIIGVVYAPDVLTTITDTPYFNEFSTVMPGKGDVLRTDGNPIHNAKCLTFPYNYVIAKSGTGDQMTIKYEEHADSNGTIYHFVQGHGGISTQCRYGVFEEQRVPNNNIKTLVMPEYPQLPIRGDTFGAWFGSNILGTAIGLSNSAIQIEAGKTSFNTGHRMEGLRTNHGAIAAKGLNMMTGGIEQAAGLISNFNQAFNAPDKMVGVSNDYDAVAFKLYKIVYYHAQPNAGDITSVDDYFDTYGYNINRFGIPNLKVRQYFTYVKTANAECRAAVPSDGIDQICKMLNAGTTFWNVAAGDIGVKREENPDA